MSRQRQKGAHETPGSPGEGGVKSRKRFWKEVIQLCQHAHQEAGWQERELPGSLPGKVSVSHQKGRGTPSHAGINEPNSRGQSTLSSSPSTRPYENKLKNLRLCSWNYWDSTVLFYAVTSIYTQYIKYKNVLTTTNHRTQKYTFGQIGQEHTQKESIRMGEFVCFNVVILNRKIFKE